MNPIATALMVFACVFGAAVVGALLRNLLPQDHLSPDTQDAVKLAMGLVATMAALVLGLLVAAAKDSYDTKKSETIQMAAKVAFLDRALAHYGPDAGQTRILLHQAVEHMVTRVWPESGSQPVELDPSASSGEALYDSIEKLSPRNDSQQLLKSQALASAAEVGQMRWLLFEQSGSSISIPFLIVVVFWLAIIFLSFGLFAPSNATVFVALTVAALSVSGAIFLILELDHPFTGLIRISSQPMHNLLSHLGH